MVVCAAIVAGPAVLIAFLGQFRRRPADQFEKEELQMTTGTIKKLVSDRGFGFITAEDGKEYFFHRSAIDNFDSLRGNEHVEFDVEDSPKGPRASQVRVSQGAPAAAATPAPAAAEPAVEEAAPAAESAAEEAPAGEAEAPAEEEPVAEAEAEHSDVQ